MPDNIILLGMMGAGKTTVGRLLARRLGKVFRDSDHEIEQRTGVRIPVIFEIEGEAGFRRREAAMIAELSGLHNLVLATGGGAVLLPENRVALRAGGCVVYLRAAVDDLFERTRQDRSRPLLQTPDPRAKLEELFAQRDPLYRETAHLVVDTSRQSVRSLVERLIRRLTEWQTHADRTP